MPLVCVWLSKLQVILFDFCRYGRCQSFCIVVLDVPRCIVLCLFGWSLCLLTITFLVARNSNPASSFLPYLVGGLQAEFLCLNISRTLGYFFEVRIHSPDVNHANNIKKRTKSRFKRVIRMALFVFSLTFSNSILVYRCNTSEQGLPITTSSQQL